MLFSKRGQKVEMLAGSTNEDHQVGDVLPQNLVLGTSGYFLFLFFWAYDVMHISFSQHLYEAGVLCRTRILGSGMI